MVSELGFPSQGFVGQKIYFSGIFFFEKREGRAKRHDWNFRGWKFFSGLQFTVRTVQRLYGQVRTVYRQKQKFTDFSEISDFLEFLWVFRKKAVLGENREIFVKEVFFVDFCLELEDFWVLEVNLKIFAVF